MNGVRAKIAGACMIAALMIGGLIPTPAGAVSQRPAADHQFAGVYTAHVKWQLFGKATFTLTLDANHQGHDSDGDAIIWRSKGKNINFTLFASDRSATYTGKASKKGIGTKNKPGDMHNDTGDSGTWYAVLQPG
jgi:hypothetical protein